MWSRCRLCAGAATAGSQLYAAAPARRPLATLVNTYLPLKVVDNGKYPRTICPGCNIQLEATAQFLELVIEGQNKLRELSKSKGLSENSDISNGDDAESFIHVSEDGSIYPADHNTSLRMAGIDKPKKKRGRPKKMTKTHIPVVLEINPPIVEKQIIPQQIEKKEEPPNLDSKRRRMPPKRYTEIVQGKELEDIFKDAIDSDSEIEKVEKKNIAQEKLKNVKNISNEVIGHMETLDGTNLGQLVVVNKYKEKFDRKGRGRAIYTCTVCGLELNTIKRYMSHVASHSQSEITGQDIGSTDFMEKVTVEINDVAKDFADFSENPYFDTGPSMPDISSDMIATIETNEKLNVTPILDSIANDIFPETNPCIDPTTNIINMETETPDMQPATEANIPEASSVDVDVNIKSKIRPLNAYKFQCAECGKIFNSRQACDVHLKTQHLGERPFKCEHCNYTFAYKISLRRHLLQHFPRGENGFACDICGKVLNHPSSVNYHKITVHSDGQRFICNKCGKSFKHRQLLKRHQIVHTENRPFSCNVCTATFKTKANLVNHAQTHAGIKRFSCEYCSQQFSHKTGLTQHIRWHFGEKPFKCSVCSKSFSQNGNLTEHMRIHTGEKPFACTLCQRTFTTSSHIRIHMERHKNDRPWQCQECGKRFLNKAVWKYHLRRHRGEKPFVCQDCGKRFTERNSLRKHSRIHSGEKPFVCDICNKHYSDSSNFAKHKKSHRDVIQSTETNTNPELVSIDESVLDNHVLCVSFNAGEDSEEHPTFHIVNENEMNNLNNCGYYETETDLTGNDNNAVIDDTVLVSEVQTSNTIFDEFVDEDGNTIQFNLQDSGQFSVTADGKLLEIEENGELILNRELEEVTLTSEEFSESTKETIPSSQTTKFLGSLDETAFSQYFTIV